MLQGITGGTSPNNLAEGTSPNNLAEKKKESDKSVKDFFNALGKQYDDRQATLGSEIKNLEIFKRNLHKTLNQIDKPFPNNS